MYAAAKQPSVASWLVGVLLATCLQGCGARSELFAPAAEETAGDGAGGQGGAGGAPSTPRCVPSDVSFILGGELRDFSDDHPDFEQGVLGDDRGIVAPTLGADGLPIYTGRPDTLTTNGALWFDSWFRDRPGINQTTRFERVSERIGQVVTVTDAAFFPIDDQLLGNQGREHNYHFTLHAHFDFERRGGEVFSFVGDDDLFVFVDGKLALDLGGVHSAQPGDFAIDDLAGPFELAVGQSYRLDLFLAERQTSGSSFALALGGFAFCAEF